MESTRLAAGGEYNSPGNPPVRIQCGDAYESITFRIECEGKVTGKKSKVKPNDREIFANCAGV
jgi:hypothetical protein